MNIRMLHDQLVRQIQKFGADAREARQVYKRLLDLLPDRVSHIALSFTKSPSGGSQKLRMVYTSPEFREYIEEIVSVGASSLEAKIQYETHMMLIDARRTLRRNLR